MASRATVQLRFDDADARISLAGGDATLSSPDGTSLTLNVSAALRILSLMEAKGLLPQLPDEWWHETQRRFGPNTED